MIARVHLRLPEMIHLQKGEFTPRRKEKGAYSVEINLREMIAIGSSKSSSVSVSDRGVECTPVETLVIDFHAEEFNRTPSVWDPPLSIIYDVANDFIGKYRVVGSAAFFKPFDPGRNSVRVNYLNNDESELIRDEQKFRKRAKANSEVKFAALTTEQWDFIHSMPDTYVPPLWEMLLLDAFDLLPRTGEAVFLACTALEVFIQQALDQLATPEKVSGEIWEWISERKDRIGDERFDALLRAFTGRSLKDSNPLWQAFQELKRVRNNFVHKGVPLLDGVPVSAQKSKELIRSAFDIVGYVEEQLPLASRRPRFVPRIVPNFTITAKLVENQGGKIVVHNET